MWFWNLLADAREQLSSPHMVNLYGWIIGLAVIAFGALGLLAWIQSEVRDWKKQRSKARR